MKKRLPLFILPLALLMSLCPAAFASEAATEATREADQCGENVFWSYADGTLTITGSGDMDDLYENVPWEPYKEELTTVIFEGDITYIGAHAFTDYDALQSVEFGTALYEIGYEAFKSCDGLTSITLPASFKVFGEDCFMSCKNLTEIHCQGRFPSFRQNCLWETYCVIYFPAENPWGVEYIAQLEEAFHGRIEFLASDGTDPYVPTEATEPEETTVETTVETTAATEPETTAETTTETTAKTTEPETTAETVSEPPAVTSEETAEPQAAPQKSGSWTPIVIVAVVAVLLVLGFLVFGRKGKGGKYAR